jgi:hypothetical protein
MQAPSVCNRIVPLVEEPVKLKKSSVPQPGISASQDSEPIIDETRWDEFYMLFRAQRPMKTS